MLSLLLFLAPACSNTDDQAPEREPHVLDGYFGLAWGTRCDAGQELWPTCKGQAQPDKKWIFYYCRQDIGQVELDLVLECMDGVFTGAYAEADVPEEAVPLVTEHLKQVWGEPDRKGPNAQKWIWDNARAWWRYKDGEFSIFASYHTY